MARPRTCLIATVKNEAPWLLEWVAHNKVIGFDTIVIASNDCTDGTDRVLDRLAALGHVRHLRNPGPWENNSPQMAAYALARQTKEVRTADWIMPLDSDEFLNVHMGRHGVQDLLASLPSDTEAVAVFWRVFGDSFMNGIPQPPVVRKFRRAATPETNHYALKVLFRNHTRFPLMRAHGPHVEGEDGDPVPFTCIVRKANGERMPDDILTRPGKGNQLNNLPKAQGTWQGAQINHYMVRTEAAFRLKKLRGGALSPRADHPRHQPKFFEKFNRNDTTDTTILATDMAREKMRKALMRDPELRLLHDTAIATARRTAQTLEPIVQRSAMRQWVHRLTSGRL